MSDATRKLATIVALDVAGYSARTEADEEKTTSEVAALRGVIDGIALRHGGRVFNTAGDGFMLEFGSSLGAVEAAFELAEKCAPQVRVGVHLGDVAVQPNGDLLGHGVNVAARLMAKSDPGGVLISADVRRTIRGPLAQRLISRGLMQLDKMAETIEAFAVSADRREAVVTPASHASPLLAVLPFDNLSNDPDMQFFSEGIAEEILQTVSRIRGLNVIGRSSSFRLRGPDKGLANVVHSLKATHVLDGSVRRSGNRLRISAQLVEGASQTTLWSERFDRELTDVFLVQDEIAQAVAATLDLTFKAGATSPKLDATTLDLYLRARRLMPTSTLEAMSRAALLFEHAVEREPRFANAWAGLAVTRAWLSRMDPVAGDMHADKADAAVARALALDPNNGWALNARTVTHPAIGRFAERAAEYESILKTSTAPATVLTPETHCMFNADLGRLSDAIAIGRRALAIDPFNAGAAGALGRVLAVAGRHEEALEVLAKSLEHQPDFIYPGIAAIVCAAQSGRWDIVDQMLAPDRLAKYPLGRFERPARATAAALRRPSREAGLQVALAAARSAKRYGWANFESLALAAHLGAVEEAFAVTQALVVAPERARSATVGPDIYQTHAVFTAAYPEIRRDKRFVRLCAKAGLVDYWLETQHWPDCVDEVARYYDFESECARVAEERSGA